MQINFNIKGTEGAISRIKIIKRSQAIWIVNDNLNNRETGTVY